MRKLKSLKSITWQDFVKSNVHEINTWPYLPSGILKKSEEYDLNKETNKLMKFQDEDYREVKRFVETFSEKQKTALSWILTAFIAVLGNLAVNLAFALPILADNMYWMFLILIIVVALTITYLKFLPKVSAIIGFIPSYVTFPEGYEKFITQAPCTKLHSKIIFNFERLGEKVIEFGKLVRVTILKSRLCPTLKKTSYIRISKITDVGKGLAYYIEISTKGAKLWLDPRGREKIELEFREMVAAMLTARQICSVHRFELNPKEWDVHGCDFIDGISEWDLEQVRKAIIDELQAECG